MVFSFGFQIVQQSTWPLFFILNFSVWNLSQIFVLCGWHWWVWHSSPLLLMALNLMIYDLCCVDLSLVCRNLCNFAGKNSRWNLAHIINWHHETLTIGFFMSMFVSAKPKNWRHNIWFIPKLYSQSDQWATPDLRYLHRGSEVLIQ